MEIKTTTHSYELTGTTRIFGALAFNPNVYSDYIGSKAPNPAKGLQEASMLPTEEQVKKDDNEEVETRGYTVFLREDGKLCLSSHVIMGFLKESLSTLKTQFGIVNPTSKIDNLVFIDPAYLIFTRNGQPITQKDYDFERPMRVMTMQGPRVSVAKSEVLDPEWTIQFQLTLLDNAETKKSKALSWELIEGAFDYGALKGLGQWRNAQNGRFTWKRLD